MKKNRVSKFNEIIEFEKEFNLFEKKACDVYYWHILRTKIHWNIFVQNDILEKTVLIEKNIIARLVGKIAGYFRLKYKDIKKTIDTELYGYLNRRRKVDNLVFEWRKTKVNGKYIDTYIQPIIDDLEKKGDSYEVVLTRNTPKEDKVRPSKLASYPDDFGFDYKKIRKNKIFTLTEEERKGVKEIEFHLYERFGLEFDFDFEDFILSLVRGFWIRKEVIKKALLCREVKNVYLVNAVNRPFMPIVAACKEVGVKTIEIQHGVINRYHSHYFYSDIKNIPYLVDEFWFWGKYWIEQNPELCSLVQPKIIGNAFANSQILKYANREKINKTILFLSQPGGLGKKLFHYAINVAKNNSNYSVVFKLHPTEILQYNKNEYGGVDPSITNFMVEKDSVEIYEILKQAEYVFGISSTGLYEALLCECKVAIVDFDYYETVSDLYSNNLALLVSKYEYCIDKFDFSKMVKINKEDFI